MTATTTSTHERTPPADAAAESALIGCMLLSRHAIGDADQIIQPTDFYHLRNQTIYNAILHLYNQDITPDPITVADRLGKQLGQVGGVLYLHDCIASATAASSATYYARIVADKAMMRRLAEAGLAVADIGFSPADEPHLAVDRAQQLLFNVNSRRSGNDMSPLDQLLQPALDHIEAAGENGGALTGIPTGFADLDKLTNGLHGGQLIVVAGRPGLGKSTAGLDFLRAATVKHNLAGAIFSLEMSKVEIILRLLSAEARVPLHVLRAGNLSEDDWIKLARRMGEISDAPLHVDDSPNMTLTEIRSKARRLNQQIVKNSEARDRLRLIVVDYLQLMTSPQRTESRQQEVAELSRGLKLLAKEVDCPVVAISQLNRGPENRTDKRPNLADLRDSGAIEQDADIVILLHRDDYYDKNSPRAGEADFIIAKHRNGPTDTITVAAQLHLSRFVDMAII